MGDMSSKVSNDATDNKSCNTSKEQTKKPKEYDKGVVADSESIDVDNEFKFYRNRKLGDRYSSTFIGKMISCDEKIIIKVFDYKSSSKKYFNVLREIKILEFIRDNPNEYVIGVRDIILKSDKTYAVVEYCDGNLASFMETSI